ncbi:MAG: hypothetical protein E6G67_13645 [Actinobacteria bacterium]|nr:MAG: hypothetical protein E6G67_13645 [Actinomycetota bacterium]
MPRPSGPKPRFVPVDVVEARRLTGLTTAQLLSLPGTQSVRRVFPGGRREAALRLPAELVPGASLGEGGVAFAV